jgi:hypothetical protein
VGTSPASPTPIASSGLSNPIAIFGPTLPAGAGYGEFGGFFEVTGLAPNEVVDALVIENPCSHSGCPSDISFNFGAFDGGSPTTLQSTGGGCASGPVTADANGNLFIQVGKSGDSGAETNFGLELMLPPPVDAAALDAADDGG